MANYRLVSNATFRPFSFEEYVKPYQMYGEAYKEIEMNISDLEEKAGKWDKLANELSDPKTHATYKAYADELRAQADLLSRYGMSPLLRRRAAIMRGRYAKDIEPIEALYNKREQLRLEQHLLNVASHGTLRFDNDYSKMSLDKMIEDPSMTYDFVSGELIAADAAARVLAVARDAGERVGLEVDEDGNTVGVGKEVRGEYPFYISNKVKGLTLEDAEKAIRGDADANPYLLQIWKEIEDLYKDNPAYNSEWAKPYIAKGVREGVLGRESNLIGNPGFENKLAWAKQDEDARSHKAQEALESKRIAVTREGNILSYKASLASTAASERNNKRSVAALMYGDRLSYLAQKERTKLEEAQLNIGLAADGKVFRNGKVVEMSESEKRNSPIYQSARNKDGQRKAISISGGTGMFVSVAANKQGRTLQDKSLKGTPGISYRTLNKLQEDLKKGKLLLYTYNERGSLMGVGGLAPHAQKEIATQLKKWGDVVRPEHFVYAVTVGPQGAAKEAVLIPIDLLPELELSNSKSK